VALLDRGRSHRTFRRLTGARLETLLAEAIPGQKTQAIAEGTGAADQGADGSAGEAGQGSGGNGQKGKAQGGSGGKTDPPGDATD